MRALQVSKIEITGFWFGPELEERLFAPKFSQNFLKMYENNMQNSNIDE